MESKPERSLFVSALFGGANSGPEFGQKPPILMNDFAMKILDEKYSLFAFFFQSVLQCFVV